jgi:hypothetical protein
MIRDSLSGQEGKNVPETASCFKIADRSRVRLIVEIISASLKGDSK